MRPAPKGVPPWVRIAARAALRLQGHPAPDELAAGLVAEPAIAAPRLPAPPKRAAPPVTPYTAHQ